MGANDSRAVASLDPRGSIVSIYVLDHYTLLHTKYISSGPHGLREGDFLSFPIIGLWELMTPGCGQFGSQGHGCQDLCRRPLNIASYIIF